MHETYIGKWWFLETWQYSWGAAKSHLQDIQVYLKEQKFFYYEDFRITAAVADDYYRH